MACEVAVAPARAQKLFSPSLIHGAIHGSILLLLPWFLLSLNSNWIYTPKGTIDPWLYHGLFRQHAYLTTQFPGTYYATRLPWVLPGLLAYATLAPLEANYVLHLCFYYLTVFALYYTIRTIAEARTALLTTVLFGLNYLFFYEVGWDYISCPILAYLTITFALVTKALVSKQPAPWLCSAGASFACVLYCHFYPALLAPTVLLYYVFADRKRNGTSLLQSAGRLVGWFALGTVLITVGLGAANVLLHGQFWFYLPSLRASLAIAKITHQWKGASYSWLYIADWLILPAAVVVASFVMLVKAAVGLRKQAAPWTVLLPSLIILLAAVCVGVERSGQFFLQYHFYCCFLLPFVFMALAIHWTRVPADMSNGQLYLLIASIFALFAYGMSHDGIARWFSTREAMVATAAIVSGIGLALATLARPRGMVVAGLALWMTLLSTTFDPFYLLSRHDPVTFSRISTSIDVVGEFCHEQNRRVRFWYDNKEPQAWEFISISSAYFYGYSWINDQFPSLQSAQPLSLVAGEPVVILSASDQAATRAEQSLKEINLGFRTLAVREVALDSVRYFLTLGVVEAR